MESKDTLMERSLHGQPHTELAGSGRETRTTSSRLLKRGRMHLLGAAFHTEKQLDSIGKLNPVPESRLKRPDPGVLVRL